MKESEHVIQCQAIQWIRQNTPYVCYAIPNGGSRGRRQGAALKAEGVLAGIPDLHIPLLALFIEMKTSIGKVSPIQKAMHEDLRRDGQIVEVCRSVDDVIRVVTHHMEWRCGKKPTRQPIRKVVKA
jgi:hypothetical protein